MVGGERRERDEWHGVENNEGPAFDFDGDYSYGGVVPHSSR